MHRARGSLLAVSVATMFAPVACQAGAVERPAAPPSPAVVELTMTEHQYQAMPEEVPPGRVVFRLKNEGSEGHQPTLVALPEDFPPLAEQLAGGERRDVPTVAGNPGIGPGVTGAVAVDLAPGQRYAFICYAKTDDGRDHSRMGMIWEFRTTGAANTTTTTVPVQE